MSFGIKELLIILVIVALIFGTKRLRGMGSDIGGAVKSFRKAMDEAEDTQAQISKTADDPAPQAHADAPQKSDSSH